MEESNTELKKQIIELKEHKNRYKRERDDIRKELELALEIIDAIEVYFILKQKGLIINR